MYLVAKDGKLFVRDVCGDVVCFWPLVLSVAQFTEQYGQPRLLQLLAGETVQDSGRDDFAYVTADGIILALPQGGETRTAWRENLREVVQ
jgi:hypothetical protein